MGSAGRTRTYNQWINSSIRGYIGLHRCRSVWVVLPWWRLTILEVSTSVWFGHYRRESVCLADTSRTPWLAASLSAVE